MIPIMTLLISIVQMMHTVICISKGWKRFRSSNTSIILSGLKIGINGIGFIISYISAEPRYIPGILIGVGLMFASIIIPRDEK